MSTWYRFQQGVTTRGRLMEIGSRFARSLLVANHDAMMRGAREGVLGLGSQARSTAER